MPAVTSWSLVPLGAHLTASLASAPTTSTSSPFVTLEPTQHGTIPGDASDPADFYGIGLALLAIALVVVLTRLIFRNRPPSRGSRED